MRYIVIAISVIVLIGSVQHKHEHPEHRDTLFLQRRSVSYSKIV
jgi:hypothetical protein